MGGLRKRWERTNPMKKQKIGLPISSFSFLSNFSHDEKEKNLDTLTSDNLKAGKKDFAGNY